MVNHNTRADFAARLADKHDVSRWVATRLAVDTNHALDETGDPIAFSPKEDGIAI